MTGITEIKPATIDEQVVAWMRRHIELHKELAEPFYFDDAMIEEINTRDSDIHIYDKAAIYRMAKAANAAWRIIDRGDDTDYKYQIEFRFEGVLFFAIFREDKLTEEDKALLEGTK